MAIIDIAVYVNGARTADPESLEETFEVIHGRSGLGWISLDRPTADEVRAVSAEFELHHLAVDDALAGHQRAKLERYGDTAFVVLRPARYLDESESVEFGELHVFIGLDFVVTIQHAESPDLATVRSRLEDDPALLARGPHAVLYAILDQVVDEYVPVVDGLQTDIDEIEDQLFSGAPEVSRRIYELLREVINFQRATDPLSDMFELLKDLTDGNDGALELRRLFRDVHDHVQKVRERSSTFRQLLQNALTVHSTLVTQQQNDEMRKLTESGLKQNAETKRLSETSLAATEQTKRISSWAAILFAPTLIGTIYGMNFEYMPELAWPIGYPLAVTAMATMGVGLWLAFKRKNWL